MNDIKDFVRFFYRLYNNNINYKDNNFQFKIKDKADIFNLQLSNPDNDIPSQLEFWIWSYNNKVTFELSKTREITRKLYPNEISFFQRVIETLSFIKTEKVNSLNVLIPFQNPHLEQIADDEEEEDDMDVISVNSENSMTYTLQNESDSDDDVEILSESDDEIEIL